VKKTKLIACVLAVCIVVLIGVIAIKATKKEDEITTAPADDSTFTVGTYDLTGEESTTALRDEATENAVTSTISDTANTYEYAYAGYNPQLADMNVADWTLILVNRNYILPEDYVPDLDYAVTGDTSSKKLDSRVAPHYNEMYLAAKEDGITLTTVSGYRSWDLQKSNFERKINKYLDMGYSKVEATQEAATIILPPGTSEHNAGLAMDICSLEQSFENTEEFEWLMENAEDYGFILRYPKDKQDKTEIIYEPWHWRYVGVENAKKINASGLCLEEYLGVVS
jgi:zinc D-Ala-D-Ala carboxypeptidase